MRHSVFGRKLNRDVKSRQILFKSLVNRLIEYERIETTEARAKSIKGLVDSLIYEATIKSDTTRNLLIKSLGEGKMIDKLLNVIGPRFKGRIGGYTRITHINTRSGDNASMVQMELVELSENETEKPVKLETKKVEKIQKEPARRKSGNKVNKDK